MPGSASDSGSLTGRLAGWSESGWPAADSAGSDIMINFTESDLSELAPGRATTRVASQDPGPRDRHRDGDESGKTRFRVGGWIRRVAAASPLPARAGPAPVPSLSRGPGQPQAGSTSTCAAS